MRIRIAFGAAVFVCSLAALGQDASNSERGFAPNGVFNAGDIDAINLFNGNLTINIPLKPATYPLDGGHSFGIALVYTGNPWDFVRGGPNRTRIVTPNRRSNAGLGWRVSMGRVIVPTDPSSPAGYGYESPDGATHKFYDTLHPNETAITGTKYTRDNTYLRLQINTTTDTTNFPDGTRLDMTFPDGMVHSFDEDGNLRLVTTPPESTASITVDYPALTSCTDAGDAAGDVCWRIRDTTGGATRTSYVIFDSDQAMETGLRARRISLQGPSSSHLNYIFGYLGPVSGQSSDCTTQPNYDGKYHTCIAPDDWTCYTATAPSLFVVPLLAKITLPDSTQYTFTYFNEPTACAQASLDTLTFPTLGTLSYTYQNYMQIIKPFDDVPSVAGVKTRTTKGGTWTYTATTADNGSPIGGALPCTSGDPEDRELQVSVARPATGGGTDSTQVHYFSTATHACYVDGESGWDPGEYALPLTHRSGTSWGATGRLLSTQIKDSNGVLLRTAYVTYEGDTTGLMVGNSADNDRRLSGATTVFDDDLPNNKKYVDTSNTSFDGLGHYRQTATKGTNFSDSETWTSVQHFNPSFADYSVGNLGHMQPPSSWILNTFDYATKSDGTSTVRSDACFDSYGEMTRSRSRQADGTLGANDVLVTHTYTSGNLAEEKVYGANAGGLGLQSDVCSVTLPSSPVYDIQHGYTYGIRSSSQYFDGATAIDGTKFLNLTVDPSGIVTAEADTSGITTSYTFDALLRVKTVTRPGTATASYNYASATSTAPATVTETQSDITRTYSYDEWGRLTKETRVMPAGTATRTTSYEPLDRKSSVSEWDFSTTPAHVTSFSYDPFGRIVSTTLPDQSLATVAYTGISKVEKAIVQNTTSKGVMTGDTGETATTKEQYDSAGRLGSVTEPVGTVTTYTYDVANHLTSVTMNGTQIRTFDYTNSSGGVDGRGFLKGETHPENGSVTYTYDPRGHVLTKSFETNSQYNLTFAYDKAERLQTVQGYDPGSSAFRNLKSFTYGTSGAAAGKLLTATRDNYVAGSHFQVMETYGYDDTSGRLASKQTDILDLTRNITLQTLNQSQSYDTLGEATTITYPHCSNCGQTTWASITPGYTNGLLTSIRGIGSLAYAANGMTTSVVHGGTTDTYDFDTTNGMARPSSIKFDPWSTCTAPSILTEPADQYITSGHSANLSVTGSASVNAYQWYDATNNPSAPISSATTASYTTPPLTSDHTYSVAVANSCGRVMSSTARVHICASIISYTADQNYTGPMNLTVSAAGTNLHYQWYLGTSGTTTTPVGTDSSTYATGPLTGTTRFWVRVTGVTGCSSADSGTITITFVCPTITSYTPDQNYAGPMNLTVTATGTNLHYQWYRGMYPATSNPVGSDSSTYPTGTLNSTTYYWAQVTGGAGCTAAHSGTITITIPLAAPSGLIAVGSPSQVALTWNAVSGASTYVVQRWDNGVSYRNIKNVSTTSTTDTTVASNAAYIYRVYATDSFGGSVSPFSNADSATTITFNTVASGSPVQLSDFQQILTGINLLRALVPLSALSWSSPAPQSGGAVLAQHVTFLRSSLNFARGQLGVASISFTDDPLNAGRPVRAVHIQQLQGGLQ